MASTSDSKFSLMEWGAIWSVVLVWGVNNAAAKFATASLPPMLIGGGRVAVALAFLFPFIKPPFPAWRTFVPVLLLLGPLHFGVVYWGFSLAHNLSLFSVTLQLWIPLTALFSWMILREAMPRLSLAGMAVAFAGVAYMTLDPRTAGDVKAVLVGVCASTIWALGTVLVRRMPQARPLKVQACISLVAAPTLLTMSLLTEPHVVERARAASWAVWTSIGYAGLVSSVGATVFLFWLVQRREAGRFTPYLLATPLITSALGVALFHDVLTARLIGGGLATLVGVALVALAERRRTRSAIELEVS